jgi:hypothetical protein
MSQSTGGRPPTVVENPFVFEEDGYSANELMNDDALSISLEDILVGCCRALKSESGSKQELVSWSRLVWIYKFVDVITRQNVQEHLGCSEAQAKRYIQVIKLANPFIKRHKLHNRSPYRSYIELTNHQVEAGYMLL